MDGVPSDAHILQAINLTSNCPDTTLNRNCSLAVQRGLDEVSILPPRPDVLLLCGSGPSLTDWFPYAQKLYPGAHIMALNGAYAHLREKFGIDAEWMAMLDARPCNTNFVETVAPMTTVLLASQVAPEVFDLVPASQTRLFHLNAPSAREAAPGRKVYYGSAGGTVGPVALVLAATLGYRNVVILGFDSSFTAGASHARHQPQNDADATMAVWLEDRKYITTPAMASQVMQFRTYYEQFSKICPDLAVELIGSGLFYDYLVTGQTRTPTRESEAARYEELYAESTYRMSPARRAEVERLFAEYAGPKDSLLDVGTGRGETMDLAIDAGFAVIHGTETVPDLIAARDLTRALLPILPFGDGQFELVTCFEVLEHLLPEDVLPALEELARVASREVIVSVCTVPDIRGGVNLHPSFRSEAEWEEALKLAWGDDAKIEKIGQASSIGVSPVYRLTK